MGFLDAMRSFHSGLFEALEGAFLGGTGSHRYRCADCDREFDAAGERRDDVACPACGGTNVGTRDARQ